MEVVDVVKRFDEYLTARNYTFEATVVGGAALTLLQVISRVTNDIDIITPGQLPAFIQKAAEDFAIDEQLPVGWLNCGPADVGRFLPVGWESRCRSVYDGVSLRLITLGRLEMLMTKCWAYCDRERDLQDIVALRPSAEEIDVIVQWLLPLDANPGWPAYVEKLFSALKLKIAEG